MPRIPVIQRAEEADQIAKILIAKYHPHLSNTDLLFLFTDQRRLRCDRVRLGTAAKMSSLQRFLSSTMESVKSGFDFIIMLDLNEWPNLTEKQQRSLVDHELEHIKPFVKSGTKWVRLPQDSNVEDFVESRLGLVDHDISEFTVIVQRYGMWRTDGPEEKFAEAVRQLTLPGLAVMAQSRN